MKIVSIGDKIKTVPDEWDRQYPPKVCNFDKAEIGRKLRASKLTSRQDVRKIIGNDSCTDLYCDECKQHNLNQVIQLGDEPDYDSSTVTICISCLRRALTLLKATP